MSSFDKIVKLACKPKAAPPKAKYLDPIIMATYSDDGSIHDVCKALSPRLREPNSIIVFKALIVLHTMIRNGATDNVLSYLSQNEVLRLKNVASGQWEGYDAPPNLILYSTYLETRVKAYKDLKHDAIRVQSESNRDAHVNNDSTPKKNGAGQVPQRSKTVMGRKLRSLAVEKGLLRETKAVQKQMDALLACKFYLDDLEDELTITALRLLVKDLLILFQAVNEGVINVLEHYFEMSHVDAEQALALYRAFCKQTEQVVEYLSIAKKLQNLINVPIPNLKHAPVSLAGALEEYLRDPNFEQNRIEYKTAKDIADGKVKPSQTKQEQPKTGSAPSASSKIAPQPSSTQTPSKPEQNNALVDFFASIEEGQHDMFNPQTNSPSAVYFNQQAVSNPFVQRQSMVIPQMTGAFPGAFPGAQAPFIPSQPTGFPMVGNAGPFPNAGQPQPFLQPMRTGFPQPNFLPNQPATMVQPQPMPQQLLQPQPTGANPFRQSMFVQPNMGPQPTGMPMPSAQFSAPMRSTSAFQPAVAAPVPQGPTSAQATGAPNQPFKAPPSSFTMPQRSASTPLTNPGQGSGPMAAPLVATKTGSRNPFAAPEGSAPPVPPMPAAPSLNAMRTGAAAGWQSSFHPSQFSSSLAPVPEQPKAAPSAAPAAGDMSSIASSFAVNKTGAASNSPFGSAFGQSNGQASGNTVTPFSSAFGGSSGGQNGQSNTKTGGNTVTPFPSAFSGSNAEPERPALAPLQVQQTGFAGSTVKPFQPTSSFGASLLASLPPISSPTAMCSNQTATSPSTTSTPSMSFSGASSQTTGFSAASGRTGLNGTGGQPQQNNSSAFSQSFGQSSGPQGSNLGGGLMPQPTGMANPFRASTLGPSGGSPFGQSPFANAGQSGGPTPYPAPTGGGGPAFQTGSTPFNQAFTPANQAKDGPFGSLI